MKIGFSARLAIGLVAAVALVIASVLLLSQQTPARGRSIESMFEDDQLLVDPPFSPTGNATVANTLTTLKLLGVDRIRVLVEWSQVAPDASDSTAPAGFDAAKPGAYPVNSSMAGWSRFDRIDEAATADGIAVDFDLTGPAPLWASTPLPAGSSATDAQYADTYGPSATAFEQFVEAAGRRYSGRYAPTGATGHRLPRVSFWSVWNEPNQPGWLSPQNNPRTGKPLAPALYRALVDAFWDGLVESGHTVATDTILVGELAPSNSGCVTRRGCAFASSGHDFWALAPITFLEDLYCVGPGGRDPTLGTAPSTGLTVLHGSAATAVGCPPGGSTSAFAAANPGLFDASGLSEHPYNFFSPPSASAAGAQERTYVPLGNLSRLESAVDSAFRDFGNGRRLPLYLTEYGYVTDPPNPDYPTTLAQQAVYLDEAEYIAVSDPRVKALSQFELQDSDPAAQCQCSKGSPGYYHSFEEGIEFLGGTPKPAYSAYRLPIFLPDLESTIPNADAAPDTPVEVWGMLRPARNHTTQTAEIQWQATGSSSWQTLARTTTRDPSGIITKDVVIPGTGAVRLEWKPSSVAAPIYSRTVAVTVQAG
jgi:hypothetical protein